MTDEEIIKEIIKCKESPYYFAKNYLTIHDSSGNLLKNTTTLSEREFNKFFEGDLTRKDIRLSINKLKTT